MADRSYTAWTPESQAAVDAALGRVAPVPNAAVLSRFSCRSLIDISGQTLAGCLVLSRLDRLAVKAGARWLVRASCGHEFAVTGSSLRNRHRQGLGVRCPHCSKKPVYDPGKQKHCRACKLPKLIDEFDRNGSSADGYRYDCKQCVEDGLTGSRPHNKKPMATADGRAWGEPRSGIHCSTCFDLPWQRRKPVCAKCHEPYRAEDELHVDVEAKREGATVWPEW